MDQQVERRNLTPLLGRWGVRTISLICPFMLSFSSEAKAPTALFAMGPLLNHMEPQGCFVVKPTWVRDGKDTFVAMTLPTKWL